jgi:hypothetical protein
VFALCDPFSLGAPLGESNFYDIVRDNAKPDPALHPVIAFVPAAIKTISGLTTRMRPSHRFAISEPALCFRLRSALASNTRSLMTAACAAPANAALQLTCA